MLSCHESLDSDLSVYLDSSNDEYIAYIGVCLIEKVSANPEDLLHKMLMGRLYNGGAKVSVLSKRFNHDARSIKKWGKALTSSNIDELALAFTGRKGKKKITPTLIAYVQQQYHYRSAMGRNYREVIINNTEDVFGVRISPSIASELFKTAKKQNTPLQDTTPIINGSNRSIGKQFETTPSLLKDTSVCASPNSPIFSDNILLSEKHLIRHAGLILFGYTLHIYDFFQQQILSQLLQGAKNIEQSKYLCFDSLRYFNNYIIPVMRSQRKLLDEEATPENTLDLYRKNSQLLSDGPNKGNTFFF